MIGIGDLRRGIAIELEGEPYLVLEYKQTKMQQRAPVLTLRLRNLRTGNVLTKNISASAIKLQLAPVESRPAQYLYEDGEFYYFMDSESFEQKPMSAEQLGDSRHYLREGMDLILMLYRGEPTGVELPTTVDLRVVDTPPGFKGDTAQGGTKPAKLETGLSVQVPLFVNGDDVVRIDTRTGKYVERA